jgi:hypothetical protein
MLNIRKLMVDGLVNKFQASLESESLLPCSKNPPLGHTLSQRTQIRIFTPGLFIIILILSYLGVDFQVISSLPVV